MRMICIKSYESRGSGVNALAVEAVPYIRVVEVSLSRPGSTHWQQLLRSRTLGSEGSSRQVAAAQILHANVGARIYLAFTTCPRG